MIKDHITESEYNNLMSQARKSWTKVITQEQKESLQSLDKEHRFEKYKKIDYDVVKRYNYLVKNRTDLKQKDKLQIFEEAAKDVLSNL